MHTHHYKRISNWVENYRHRLLLLATLLVLVLPAFSPSGLVSEILFVLSMSFLFIQSMVAAQVQKKYRVRMRVLVIVLIILVWLEPAGIESVYIEMLKLLFLVSFYVFVTAYLFRFIFRSKTVSGDVLLTAINIYLLIGIIAASVAFLLNDVYQGAYSFPEYITHPQFTHFLYFSFITMSTVGFGDITPAIPETQALAYISAITGQLYVAIAIALLVGKYLSHNPQKELLKRDNAG